MARYESDFVGIPAGFSEPTGADPNYDGGYRGMRMRGGHERAAYGDYRLIHDYELETEGGFRGLHGRGGGTGGPRYDPRWEDSGYVGDIRDPRIARDFDARSPMYADPGHDDDFDTDARRRASELPVRWRTVGAGFREGYSNRGATEAGYSDSWARAPMRGAR